jgi:hypothetical protein
LVLSDVQRKYKTLNIRFESYDRWSGRATLYLNYAYLFTQRSMSSRFIGFITGDCLITRNFLTEIETLLNDLLHQANDKNIVIIAHIGVMRCVYKFFNKASDSDAGNKNIPNNEIFLIDKNKDSGYSINSVLL